MSPSILEPRMTVLVADDEAPARRRVIDRLTRSPMIGRILEADDGLLAVDCIRGSRPDLVFLDVQMPELDGLGVVEAVGADDMPLTVFATAYDHHAIRAFEANALDYLVKPFSDERFDSTLERVRARLEERRAGTLGARMRHLLASPDRRSRPIDRLVVKAGGVTRFLPVAEVEWIEAADVYVTLHTRGQSILHRSTLGEMADRLDPRRFVRIHRSTIINIECVLQLEPLSHGEFDVVLRDGTRLRLSRTYKARLEERLGQPL
jgi:two-component system LytT family response regulator